jgi:DNA processing protein
VVGSRDANELAIEFANKVARDVVTSGRVVVSGGALGVDAAAHRSTLAAGGATIVVMGTGFKKFYPAENSDIFSPGPNVLIVTEFPPEEFGSRYTFLQRNRVTSGLANSVVICAASARSGTSVQAELAFRQGRKIILPPEGLSIAPSEGFALFRRSYSARSYE